MPLRFTNRGLSAHKKAFTLVELLVALSVTAVILGAVAAFAYAIMVANKTSDDTSQKQAQVRLATVRISEIIRYSYLVCRNSSSDIAIWTADLDLDDQIGISELVYIETNGSYIRLTTFAVGSYGTKRFTITEVSNGTARTWLNANCTPSYTNIIPSTSSVTFVVDQAAPCTRSVGILFNITENTVTKTYQINSVLRGRALKDFIIAIGGSACPD
jgi:prepilin-type N-terminal cleavage/methylation domain-containing protein